MKTLPAHILAAAFRSGAEYAWRRADIPSALRAIVDSGQAILGGEVWAVVNGQIVGAIPDLRAQNPGVWHWETSGRKRAEGWEEYCARTAQESVAAVNGMKVEENAAATFRDHLFFNVTFVDESDV